MRASLLGVADRRGPIVTLLVTSAKAGEGKSTTALNLAATCALAGERTLLLDIDLRRPSLADVFIEDEDPASVPGVVDVLKGEIPWQRTLRHTRIPNLDFIPTGDTRETPIEILGTLELRQLLLALSHHYDRVILDGPAVLGLADCRFLGRIVDSSLLVVRSGSHHLTTLHRAKSMLEQSHVAIAGVVFNGLTEDMENWSSYYGYNGVLPSPERVEAACAGRGSPVASPARLRAGPPAGRATAAPTVREDNRESPHVELRQRITGGDRPRAGRRPWSRWCSAAGCASAARSGGSRRRSSALAFLMVTIRLSQCRRPGPDGHAEEPDDLARAAGAGAGHRPVDAPAGRAGAAGLARRAGGLGHGDLVPTGAGGRSRGRADAGRPGPIAGDARPCGDAALAGPRGGLPGDLLDRLAFRRPPAVGSTGCWGACWRSSC